VAAATADLVLPDVWVNLAHIFLAQEQYNNAIKMYQNCLKKFYYNCDSQVRSHPSAPSEQPGPTREVTGSGFGGLNKVRSGVGQFWWQRDAVCVPWRRVFMGEPANSHSVVWDGGVHVTEPQPQTYGWGRPQPS